MICLAPHGKGQDLPQQPDVTLLMCQFCDSTEDINGKVNL